MKRKIVLGRAGIRVFPFASPKWLRAGDIHTPKSQTDARPSIMNGTGGLRLAHCEHWTEHKERLRRFDLHAPAARRHSE